MLHDFITSAWPWIALGLSMAILAAYVLNAKKKGMAIVICVFVGKGTAKKCQACVSSVTILLQYNKYVHTDRQKAVWRLAHIVEKQ